MQIRSVFGYHSSCGLDHFSLLPFCPICFRGLETCLCAVFVLVISVSRHSQPKLLLLARPGVSGRHQVLLESEYIGRGNQRWKSNAGLDPPSKMHGRFLLLAIFILTLCSVSIARDPICRKPRRKKQSIFGNFEIPDLLDACHNSPPDEGVSCWCNHVAGIKYSPDLECTYNAPSPRSNLDIVKLKFCNEYCVCPPSLKEAVREMVPGRRNTKAYQPLIDVDESSQSCKKDCTSFSGCDEVRSRPGCAGAVCGLDQQIAPGPWFGMGSCRSLVGRKRDVEGPICLCNGTFASRDCCWEESGIVHDGLGSLAILK